MRQTHTPLQRVITAGALLAAACAVAGLPEAAQTTSTTTSSSTTSTTTTIRVPRTTATPQMIDEAVQRSKARHQRFLTDGTPERWGSEEPFTATRK
jgi:hypothetical protein